MDETAGLGYSPGVTRLPAQETRQDQSPRNRRKQDRCAVPERDMDDVIGRAMKRDDRRARGARGDARSEEHTSELQSLMRISYAVFCLKKKKKNTNTP